MDQISNTYDKRKEKSQLEALDDTRIKIKVYVVDKVKYQNQKEVTTNVLGVCSPNMQFIYVIHGCEGSSVDSIVLCEAIRKRGGFKV